MAPGNDCTHPPAQRGQIHWYHEELNTFAARSCEACGETLYVWVQFDGNDERIRKAMEEALEGTIDAR